VERPSLAWGRSRRRRQRGPEGKRKLGLLGRTQWGREGRQERLQGEKGSIAGGRTADARGQWGGGGKGRERRGTGTGKGACTSGGEQTKQQPRKKVLEGQQLEKERSQTVRGLTKCEMQPQKLEQEDKQQNQPSAKRVRLSPPSSSSSSSNNSNRSSSNGRSSNRSSNARSPRCSRNSSSSKGLSCRRSQSSSRVMGQREPRRARQGQRRSSHRGTGRRALLRSEWSRRPRGSGRPTA